MEELKSIWASLLQCYRSFFRFIQNEEKFIAILPNQKPISEDDLIGFVTRYTVRYVATTFTLLHWNKEDCRDWVNTTIPEYSISQFDFDYNESESIEAVPYVMKLAVVYDTCIIKHPLLSTLSNNTMFCSSLTVSYLQKVVNCIDSIKHYSVTTEDATIFRNRMKMIGDYFTKSQYDLTGKFEYALSVQHEEAKDDVSTETPKQVPVTKDNEALSWLLYELDGLVGLDKVKTEVRSSINLLKARRAREKRGIKQPALSMHLVFSGNPGTGKTTIARLLAKIYKEMGILSKGHFVEVERADLVGGYVGQTAIKVKNVIEKSLGGILFIDEAYSLVQSDSEEDFGHEAINTLLKSMEDHRDNLIVIVAGYTELMAKFVSSNPGLKSRFNKFIQFDDYLPDELVQIFINMCTESGFHVDPNDMDYLFSVFEEHYNNRPANYANARDVRNYLERVMVAQANRIAEKDLDSLSSDELTSFTIDDFEMARQ